MSDLDRSWWKDKGRPFEGEFLSSFVLGEDSVEELRIQRIRHYLLENDRPRISTHRTKLFTQAYQKHEGDPPAIRKAKSFYHLMQNIPIPLIHEQLLVGSPVSFYGAIELYPEYCAECLLSKVPDKEITQLRYLPLRRNAPVDISPEDLRLLEEDILPYWKDICLGTYVWNDLNSFYPQAASFISESQVFLTNFGKGFSHTIQDYKSIVAKGLKGIKEEIEIEKDILSRNLKAQEDISRLHHYEAMLISADAVIQYAKRCTGVCEDAMDSVDPSYREELKKMSEICKRVPEYPARSWREALQSIYFTYMSTFLLEGGVSHSFGRMDYYLYPFYRDWVENGTETKQKAQELLECFFLKCYEYQSLRDAKTARGLAGDRTNDKITLGGVDDKGNDVTNELSYHFLEAHAHAHLKEPNLSIRVHKNTSERFLLSALEIVRLGSGLPLFLNDEVIIPSLISKTKVELIDAKNYADLGCQENYVDPNSSPSQADTNGHSNAGYFNLVKVLELTLNEGVNPVNSKQVGPKTPHPASFKTMDEFASAFKQQLSHAIRMNVLMNYIVEYHFSRTLPNPYHSLMHPGPRKSGIDYVAGGCRYNWIGAAGVGLATAADSLMVIEELIYNRRTCSWDEMLSALKANWDGYEELRSSSLSLPRYGASGKRAEFWAQWLVNNFCEEYEKHPILRRADKKNMFVIGLFSMGIYLVLGEDVLATPDGRFANEMLSGSIAPSQYAQALGYTATHNAAAKINTTKVPNGIVFNQYMPLNLVANSRDLKKWSALIRTYFELGGMSVQYSVIDSDELKLAQDKPYKYKELIVRVGGYSARFIDLSKEIQDEVIARVS